MSRSSVIVANPLYRQQTPPTQAIVVSTESKSGQWEEVDEAGFPEKK